MNLTGELRLAVKNWKEFQHYKDRSPSWIKLHKSTLDDAEFHRLPVASRALAPMLWLLASEYAGGVITSTIPDIAFRLRRSEDEIIEALTPLIQKGFLILEQPASKSLAEPEQVASLEKRREREEGEKSAPVSRGTEPPKFVLSEEDFQDQLIAKGIQEDHGITGQYLPRDITTAVRNMRLKEGLTGDEIRKAFNVRWSAYLKTGGKCGIKSWVEQGGYLKNTCVEKKPVLSPGERARIDREEWEAEKAARASKGVN